jgi:hypothetical protein
MNNTLNESIWGDILTMLNAPAVINFSVILNSFIFPFIMGILLSLIITCRKYNNEDFSTKWSSIAVFGHELVSFRNVSFPVKIIDGYVIFFNIAISSIALYFLFTIQKLTVLNVIFGTILCLFSGYIIGFWCFYIFFWACGDTSEISNYGSQDCPL